MNTLEESGVSVFAVRGGEKELPLSSPFLYPIYHLSLEVCSRATPKIPDFVYSKLSDQMRVLDVWSAQMGKMGERAEVPNRDLFLSFRGVWLRVVRTHARFKDLQCGDGHYFCALSI